MKIKINTDEAIMTLKDGAQMNYRAIRVTKDLRKMIFFNEQGLKEIFKPDMNEVEKANAERLKKLDEKALMKLGYVSEISLINIQPLIH